MGIELQAKLLRADMAAKALADEVARSVEAWHKTNHMLFEETVKALTRQQGELFAVQEELRAYREGGLTEEILRRHDGCLRLSRSCCVCLTSDYEDMKRQLAEAMKIIKEFVEVSPITERDLTWAREKLGIDNSLSINP